MKKPRKRPASAAPRKTGTTTKKENPAKSQASFDALRDSIDESLAEIDAEAVSSTDKPREFKRRKKRRQTWSRKRKIITWSIIGIVALLALIVGFYAFRITQNTTQMFGGSIFDLIKKDELKADANGRSNILIFGTSEDDKGHSGAQLADSIMVLSVDQKTKESYTVSIPRDLWVKYGTPCSIGSEGKINATYYCGLEAHNNDTNKASLAFTETVSKVVGTEVQYYVAVNYSVVRGLVDSLGGVDVTIKSDDPRGIYDVATKLRLENGVQHIDGKTALDLSRARNSRGGYGLAQSNFDREKNQQQVLKAIQDKALSTGTLTNPNKVIDITDSLGSNIRTNIKGSELRTALEVASGVRSADIASKPLNNESNPLVTTDRYQNQSIVRPVKGLTDYSDIHNYLNPKKW